jgi:hypothetical protein
MTTFGYDSIKYFHLRFKLYLWAKDCCSMKLDPLTNATVIGDVIKFIETEREKDDVQRPKI